MKEKPQLGPKLPAMVRAYFRCGEIASQMIRDEAKKMKFEHTRQTLFHYMTPAERALTTQMESEAARLRKQQESA